MYSRILISMFKNLTGINQILAENRCALINVTVNTSVSLVLELIINTPEKQVNDVNFTFEEFE